MYPILFQSKNFILPSWHFFFLIAVCSGFFLFLNLSEKIKDKDFSDKNLNQLFLGSYIAGFFGARFWSIIVDQTELDSFTLKLKALFSLGPLTLYGSFLAASIFFISYCKQQKISFLKLLDATAPACLLGVAIGRIGCLLNGCDYGALVSSASFWPKSLALHFSF